MAIAGKQRAREWETVAATLKGMRSLFAADPDDLAFQAAATVILEFIEDQFKKADAGCPAVWYNLGMNPELIYALGGVNNVCVSQLAAMCSIAGEQADTEAFIDAAEAKGCSKDCCSADKSGMGAAILGLYPEPSCIVGVNTPCDSQVAVSQAMAELRNDRPYFAIDVPPYEDERTIAHVASQLRDLIPFLEKHTGRKLDLERLRRSCEYTNQMSESLWQWMEWKSMVPTMQAGKLSSFTMILMISFGGSELGARLAQALAGDARLKVDRKVRYFEEKVRAVWYQDPVWWDIQLYDWMESTLGLTIPIDIFGYYANEGLVDTTSLDTMLTGLARRLIMCHPMSRQFRSGMSRYIQDFLVLHKRFKADCGIMAGHLACKHSWGGVGLFKEACRKAGIPLLVFEFDMFDPRIVTRKELQFEISRFVNDVVLPKLEREGRG